MSRTLSNQQVFLSTGNPDTTNDATLYAPGELGAVFDFNPGVNARTYQRVKLDSGATSANAVGVVAANMLAYWKDKTQKIVTNDTKQAAGASVANGFGNNVAGIFRFAVTAGNYCDILKTGNGINVASDGTGGAGATAIADVTASQARIAGIAVGTAPTYQPLGVIRVAAVANIAVVDVDIPNLD